MKLNDDVSMCNNPDFRQSETGKFIADLSECPHYSAGDPKYVVMCEFGLTEFWQFIRPISEDPLYYIKHGNDEI
jgi:hypothetical protein